MAAWFVLSLQREDTVQRASQPLLRPSQWQAGTGAVAADLGRDWALGLYLEWQVVASSVDLPPLDPAYPLQLPPLPIPNSSNQPKRSCKAFSEDPPLDPSG